MSALNKRSIIVLFVMIACISITSILSIVLGDVKTFQVEETELVQLRPLAIDIDNDTITYSYTPPLNESGEWQTTYEDAGSYNIKISASDGLEQTAQEILLIVKEKNRKPVINQQSFIIHEGDFLAASSLAADPDGDSLVYNFLPPFDEFGQWQTDFNSAGIYLLKTVISDGKSSVDAYLNITVLNVDRPPMVDLPLFLEVTENETLNWKINISDQDNDFVNITLQNAPEGMVFNPATNSIVWRPDFNTIYRRNGVFPSILNALRLEHFFLRKKTMPLAIEACAKGLCQSKTTTIIVYNNNRKPLFESVKNVTLLETEELKLKLNATDLDGDLIRYSFSPPFDAIKGVWKTKYGDRGRHLVYVTATDGNKENTVPVNINILPKNRAPSIKVFDDVITSSEGDILRFSVAANDPDKDNVTLKLNTLLQGASFKEEEFVWEIPYDIAADASDENKTVVKVLDFSAFDGEIESNRSVKVVISNVNQPPKIIDFLPEIRTAAVVNEPVLFHVAAKDEDRDDLSYEWSFSLHEPKILGTDTIERTFTSPGRKTVVVTVSDGKEKVRKKWIVNVAEERANLLNSPVVELSSIKTYVIEQ